MKTNRMIALTFVLVVAAPAFAAPFSFTSTDTPKLIADDATTTSTIFIPIGGTIGKVEDLNVLVNLLHTFDSDLVLTLRHDDTGTTAVLANQQGGAGQDYDNVTFDDEAAQPISSFVAPGSGQSFRPESPLASFIGENLMGNWTLIIQDVAAGDSGTLLSFNVAGTITPEPGTCALFGAGAAALGGLIVRRKRARAVATK
jgi:subtilisin-like proprotein convertase family protein